MSIRRERGEIVAECNECGAEYPGGTLEWGQFIMDLKDEGWRFRKVNDEWEHRCPDCVGERSR